MNSCHDPEEYLRRHHVEAPSAVGSSELLERVMTELMARRGACERKALECRCDQRDSDAREWMCRAGGIAEAIQVVQLFSDVARSNNDYANSR